MPKSTSQNSKTYAVLNAELDLCMQSLQQSGVDIDDAIKQYERALAIIAELEAYLAQAENRIREIHLQKGVETV